MLSHSNNFSLLSLFSFTHFWTQVLHRVKLVFSPGPHMPFWTPHFAYCRHLSPTIYIAVQTSGGFEPQVISNPWHVSNIHAPGVHVFAEKISGESSPISGVYVLILMIFFLLSTKKHFAEITGLPEPSCTNATYHPSSDFSVCIDFGGNWSPG